MKKHFLFGLAAALTLSACSNEEPSNPTGGEVTGGNNFLAVNVVSTPAGSSRAAEGGTTSTGNPNGNAQYEAGYASENAVSKVRFYFFHADGTAANVKANSTANYFDWTNPEDAGQDMPNIEKQLTATIVIHTGAGDQLPSQMVAVLNPDADANLGNGALSLTELYAKANDYVACATGEGGAFVMTNSVYSKNGEMYANQVTSSNYAATEADALKNPIDIYVERPVAKVRVTFGDNVKPDANGRIALKDKDGNDLKVEGQQVYLTVSGWNLTATTKNGFFRKHIDTTWDNNLFGNAEPWNWSAYFRSYWAINADENLAENRNWYTYNDIMEKGGKQFDGKLENSIYTNENAVHQAANAASAYEDVELFTKVILAGELVKEDGTPFEVTEYAGMKFAGKENLVIALLEQLNNNGMIYKKITDENGDPGFASLSKDDVTFKTAIVVGSEGVDASEQTGGRYYVYLQLTDEAANAQWSLSNAKDQAADNLHDGAWANDHLKKNLGTCQVYEAGLTYYYFPIRHLGAENNVGYYGVVRNHIYDCTLTTIAGLGTPVYDPNEVIYPEKPKDEDTFIAAQINILSWRVVPNNYELKW